MNATNSYRTEDGIFGQNTHDGVSTGHWWKRWSSELHDPESPLQHLMVMVRWVGHADQLQQRLDIWEWSMLWNGTLPMTIPAPNGIYLPPGLAKQSEG